MNSDRSNELTREQLYEKLWSAPTTQVAAELGISDVGLAKRCKKLDVPKPSPGYWAKVAAGQTPEKEPLPPAAATSNEIFAQAAEKPVPKSLPLPDTTEQMHPLAAELLRTLRAEKLSYDKRLWGKGATLPEVKVTKDAVEQAVKCFHVILTHVEAVGIPFRKAQGYGPGFFRKGNDRLYLSIEEEMVAGPDTGRRRSWQAEELRVGSGKLTFALKPKEYGSDVKQWKEDGKATLGTVVAEVVAGIRKHFVDAARRRDQEVIENKKRMIEWEKQRREYEEKEAIRLAQERKDKHEAALKATVQARSEDLLKAAEWWRLYMTAAEFIDECEWRWRAGGAELTAEQQTWLAWARENAKSMSPFEAGYPDPAKDGTFDRESITLGGPYPAKRDFPRPPTMPKIPPPAIQQQSGYGSSHIPEPPPQYPFWLKYQGR